MRFTPKHIIFATPLIAGLSILNTNVHAAACASSISTLNNASCTMPLTGSVTITGTGSIVDPNNDAGDISLSTNSVGLNLGGITVNYGGLLRYSGSTATSGGINFVYGPSGAPSSPNRLGDITINGAINSTQRGIILNGFTANKIAIGSTGTLTAAGLGIFLTDSAAVSGDIINSGTISAGSYGIWLQSSAAVSGVITNSGTVSSTNGYSVYVDGTVSGTNGITNNLGGILNGAVNVSATGTVTGGITNAGTINNTNNPDSRSINVLGSLAGGITNLASGVVNGNINVSTSTATLNNSGQINGAITFNNTTGTINLNDSASSISGAVSGTSTTVNNVGRFSTANTFDVQSFNVNSGGNLTLNNNVTLVSGNTFTNAGNVTVTASNSPTITGNYSQSGTYTFGVTSPSAYSILNVTGNASFSSSYGFYLTSSSVLAADTTYQGVLRSSAISGFSTKTYTQTLSGFSWTYQIVQDITHTGWLDLVIQGGPTISEGIPDIISSNNGGINTVANVGGIVYNQRFDGGTLKATEAVTDPVAGNFTITPNNGVIDQNGYQVNFSGDFSDDADGPGKLIIKNTGDSGVGAIILSGANTYSGGTEIQAGATLSIASGNALGSGALSLVGGVDSPATLATTADLTINNQISVSGDSVFDVSPSTTTTVNGPITNGDPSGNVVVEGGGTLALTAVNTYTGTTNIDSGSTLALIDGGSISASSTVVANGTFNIAGTTDGAFIQSLSGSGAVTLGSKELVINGTTSSTFDGVIAGVGGNLTIAGSATQTLTNTNTYTGATAINSDATLALTGSGSIAASSGVANNGTFDISGTTSGASIKTLSGNGSTTLGAKTLTLTNADDAYDGVISGSGKVIINNGSQTLGGTNTHSGGTQVDEGANLIIASGGALGSGTLSLVGGLIVPATLTTTASTTISNAVTVSGGATFNVAPDTTTVVSSAIINGTSAGQVLVAGGGILELTGVNTYTGATTINDGSVLALGGSGSIANSVAVNNTNGTFNITGKTSNVNLGGTYTQAANGNLVMNFSYVDNKKLIVAGAASLGGGLNLVASAGDYTAGRYTLITADGVSNTFDNFTSNLSSYTRFAYALGYDSDNVYLYLTPNISDTQASIQNVANALQNIYAMQNTILVNGFTYDCQLFDKNNICVSTGGRYTTLSTDLMDTTSALLIGAYRANKNMRIGAYVDQNLSTRTNANVQLNNGAPIVGLFAVWNENTDDAGAEIKLSAGYGKKDATITRSIIGASEAGAGSSTMRSSGYQAVAKYGFAINQDTVVKPYVGIRYTKNNMNGYTEGASTSVSAPLSYATLNTSATTLLAGVDVKYKVSPDATIYASAGAEKDTGVSNSNYYASGLSGLSTITFNPNATKTRAIASLGAYIDIGGNQRIGLSYIFRNEKFNRVNTNTGILTYTVGL